MSQDSISHRAEAVFGFRYAPLLGFVVSGKGQSQNGHFDGKDYVFHLTESRAAEDWGYLETLREA